MSFYPLTEIKFKIQSLWRFKSAIATHRILDAVLLRSSLEFNLHDVILWNLLYIWTSDLEKYVYPDTELCWLFIADKMHSTNPCDGKSQRLLLSTEIYKYTFDGTFVRFFVVLSFLLCLNGSFIYLFLNANVLRRHCIIVDELPSFRNGLKMSTIANQNSARKIWR